MISCLSLYIPCTTSTCDKRFFNCVCNDSNCWFINCSRNLSSLINLLSYNTNVFLQIPNNVRSNNSATSSLSFNACLKWLVNSFNHKSNSLRNKWSFFTNLIGGVFTLFWLINANSLPLSLSPLMSMSSLVSLFLLFISCCWSAIISCFCCCWWVSTLFSGVSRRDRRFGVLGVVFGVGGGCWSDVLSWWRKLWKFQVFSAYVHVSGPSVLAGWHFAIAMRICLPYMYGITCSYEQLLPRHEW